MVFEYRTIFYEFTAKFPNSPLETVYHHIMVKKFKHGLVLDVPCFGHLRMTRTEKNKINVEQSFVKRSDVIYTGCVSADLDLLRPSVTAPMVTRLHAS